MNINFAASQNVSLVSCLVSFLVFLYFKAGIGSGLFVFFFLLLRVCNILVFVKFQPSSNKPRLSLVEE